MNLIKKLFLTSLLDHGMIKVDQTSISEQFEIEIIIEFYAQKY